VSEQSARRLGSSKEPAISLLDRRGSAPHKFDSVSSTALPAARRHRKRDPTLPSRLRASRMTPERCRRRCKFEIVQRTGERRRLCTSLPAYTLNPHPHKPRCGTHPARREIKKSQHLRNGTSFLGSAISLRLGLVRLRPVGLGGHAGGLLRGPSGRTTLPANERRRNGRPLLAR